MYIYIQWGDGLVSHDFVGVWDQKWNHTMLRRQSSCLNTYLILTAGGLEHEGPPEVFRHLVLLHCPVQCFFHRLAYGARVSDLVS